MKYILTLIAFIPFGYAIFFSEHNEKPYCEISIYPDGTWTGNGTDCDFPGWGIFHPDGTWEAIQP